MFNQTNSLNCDSYFKCETILFQFILKEFFHASQENQSVLSLAENLKFKDPLQALPKDVENCLHNLHEHLVFLSGKAQEQAWTLPWDRGQSGILTKLKEYSYQFAQSAGTEDRLFHAIYEYFHQAWLGCNQTLELIKGYCSSRMRENSESELRKIRDHLARVTMCIRHASKLLMHSIYRFRHDENIALFLVRHCRAWKKFFGTRPLKNLMARMYPGGTMEIRNFLLRRYTKRGFDFLIPIIIEKVAELERVAHDMA